MNSCSRNHDQRSELAQTQDRLRGQRKKSKMEETSLDGKLLALRGASYLCAID